MGSWTSVSWASTVAPAADHGRAPQRPGLPGHEGEQEGQRVVAVFHGSRTQRRPSTRARRPSASARGRRPARRDAPGGGEREPGRGRRAGGRWADPSRRRAVARPCRRQPAHDVAVVAEEPPRLPRLEDDPGGRAVSVAPATPAAPPTSMGRRAARRPRGRASSARRAGPARQGEQHGPAASSAHALLPRRGRAAGRPGRRGRAAPRARRPRTAPRRAAPRDGRGRAPAA